LPPRQGIGKIPERSNGEEKGKRPQRTMETVTRGIRRIGPYLIASALGALLGASQVPIGWVVPGDPLPTAPAVVPEEWIRPVWLNALVGAIVGASILAAARAAVRAALQAVEAGKGVALLQGSLLGLIGTLFGLLGYAVLELLFGTGRPNLGLQLAQAGLLLFLTYLGFRIGYSQEDLLGAFVFGDAAPSPSDPSSPGGKTPKVVDTSVIIDGRIYDLVRTGFLEGPLYVPHFVVGELQRIADSQDGLRRRKGRRGLNILEELQKLPNTPIILWEEDVSEVPSVDRKLIRLAKDLKAKILTTDYNLNKVARVSGVEVLNVNELAKSLKPPFIPGEELEIEVIDRGQEIGQGVGYLDDGTMVVVENGRRYIGKKVRAVVSSSLQTDAGKMLFVRAKGEVDGQYQQSSS